MRQFSYIVLALMIFQVNADEMKENAKAEVTENSSETSTKSDDATDDASNEISGDENVDISSYENIYTEDDAGKKAEMKLNSTNKTAQDNASAKKNVMQANDMDIIISKLRKAVYELEQLANKDSVPLRDRSVCRLLLAAYKNLELYTTEMKKPMKDLKLFLTYVDLCIGNIHFLFSPKMIIGISAATEEKLKNIKYQYVDTKQSQGILLDVLEKMLRGITDSLNVTTDNGTKSIFNIVF